MNRPNPLPPHLMTPSERRAAVCNLLALGFIRLHMPTRDNYLTTLEKVRYTSRPANAVMQLHPNGEPHDDA